MLPCVVISPRGGACLSWTHPLLSSLSRWVAGRLFFDPDLLPGYRYSGPSPNSPPRTGPNVNQAIINARPGCGDPEPKWLPMSLTDFPVDSPPLIDVKAQIISALVRAHARYRKSSLSRKAQPRTVFTASLVLRHGDMSSHFYVRLKGRLSWEFPNLAEWVLY